LQVLAVLLLLRLLRLQRHTAAQCEELASRKSYRLCALGPASHLKFLHDTLP
jgi:hypothetical protein